MPSDPPSGVKPLASKATAHPTSHSFPANQVESSPSLFSKYRGCRHQWLIWPASLVFIDWVVGVISYMYINGWRP